MLLLPASSGLQHGVQDAGAARPSMRARALCLMRPLRAPLYYQGLSRDLPKWHPCSVVTIPNRDLSPPWFTNSATKVPGNPTCDKHHHCATRPCTNATLLPPYCVPTPTGRYRRHTTARAVPYWYQKSYHPTRPETGTMPLPCPTNS